MNAAYDLLRAQDWTTTRRGPVHTEAAADATSEWTDVGGSSRDYPDLTMSPGGGQNNCDGGGSNKRRSDGRKKKNIGDGERRSSDATMHYKNVLFGRKYYGVLMAA